MFKTSDRASFLIFFQLLQYYVFVVLSDDVFALFQRVTLKCVKDSFSRIGLLFAERSFIFAKMTFIMAKTIY